MKPTVRARVLENANYLFSRNGYASTGVRSIIQAAKVVPASFYDHFPSKKELGLEYLKEQEKQTLGDLSALMNQYPNPLNLLRAWVVLKKKQIKKQIFWGCPFLRFAMQNDGSDKDFSLALKETSQNWIKLLTQYFENAAAAGFIPPQRDIASFARQFLIVYEGNVAMWRITGDNAYIGNMENMFLQLYTEMVRGQTT